MPGHIVTMGGGGFSMEPDNPLASFYRAFARLDVDLSDLLLFDRDDADLRGKLLEQDVLYVGGGNTANLLAVWRVHGVDAILREALDGGAVLCGISAGMNCWFQASITDSFGPEPAPLHDGLGFISGSACPHYDGEPQRRPAYRRAVANGFPAGWAADDGAALRFDARGAFVEAVCSRPQARAYRVDANGETALEPRYLG